MDIDNISVRFLSWCCTHHDPTRKIGLRVYNVWCGLSVCHSQPKGLEICHYTSVWCVIPSCIPQRRAITILNGFFGPVVRMGWWTAIVQSTMNKWSGTFRWEGKRRTWRDRWPSSQWRWSVKRMRAMQGAVELILTRDVDHDFILNVDWMFSVWNVNAKWID